MGAALPYDNPLDRGRAAETVFSCPSEDLEVVLETTAPVNPINAGSIALDPFGQHFSNGFPEVIGLIHWDPLARVWGCIPARKRASSV